MESDRLKKRSALKALGEPSEGEARSPLIVEVVVEIDSQRKSRSVRDADELSDEEADAFFYV